MNVTIVRLWYVLRPGHRWPYVLLPMYWRCERIPPTRDGARRRGLVMLPQMTQTLLSAVENPSIGAHFIELPQTRRGASAPECGPPLLTLLKLRKRMDMGHLLPFGAG